MDGFVRSPHLAATPYAHAAVISEGALIITAGACPVDTGEMVCHQGDVAAQTRLCLDNLRLALEAAGATLADVAKATVFVVVPAAETAAHAALNAAWDEVHAALSHEPAATLLGVSRLGFAGQLVEIEAIARVPRRS